MDHAIYSLINDGATLASWPDSSSLIIEPLTSWWWIDCSSLEFCDETFGTSAGSIPAVF